MITKFNFKRYISAKFFGRKLEGIPKHINTQDAIRAFHSDMQKNSGRIRYLKSIKNSDLQSHAAEDITLYFTASEKEREIMLMIDIDCHKSGTLAGAKSFASHLTTIFPDLYSEVSTNGNGVHCYFILDRYYFKNSEVREIMNDAVAPYLSKIAKGFDIELVEIKGLPGDIIFKNGVVDTIHSGTLAKIPRGFNSPELANTYRTDITDLRHLAESNITSDDIKKNKKNLAFNGSSSFIDKDLFESYKSGNLAKLGVQLVPKIDWSEKKTRSKITADNISTAILVLNIISKDMNDDGTLPVKRVEKLWRYLYDNDIVECSYDCKKFAEIRNLLSSENLINWTDHSYSFSADGKGVACKWVIKTKLVEVSHGKISLNKFNGTVQPLINIRHTCEGQPNRKNYLVPTLVLNIRLNMPKVEEYLIPADDLWHMMVNAA